MDLKQRIHGSLLGGAVGDALGYEVEFMWLTEIKKRFGEQGILDLYGDKAVISDDTQMTLFTANALLYGFTMAINRGVIGEWKDYIWLGYKDWLATQIGYMPDNKHCWLLHIPEMHIQRAPGATCLTAIAESEKGGTIVHPINSSKGCGGVMRVAPVGLFLNPQNIYTEDTLAYVCKVGAQAAALTHGHPLGYIPAGYLAALVNLLAYPGFYGEASLADNMKKALKTTCKLFEAEIYTEDFRVLMERAFELASAELGDEDAVFTLGEGWVGEEAMAIAALSALRHENDFAAAIRMAANHDGDSDSTAAIAGNILGTLLGDEAVKQAFSVDKLELTQVIEEISCDLAYAASQSDYDADIESDEWAAKYIFVKR